MILLIRALQSLLALIFLLPVPLAIRLLRLLGELFYRIARLTGIKRTVIKNIRLVLPASAAPLLADKLLKNFSYSIFEMLSVPYFKEAHLDRICQAVGIENMDLALAKRKGALFLTMHTGNYELIPILLRSRGYHINSILKAEKDDPLMEVVNRSRGYKGIRLINILEKNMYREALQALSKNQVVGLMIDTGALEGRYELIPFLGRQVPVATGWLTLAQRSGAEIIPIFSRREGKNLIMTFGTPLSVNKDNREEVKQRVGAFFERMIRNHPDQWGIFLNKHETRRMVEGK